VFWGAGGPAVVGVTRGGVTVVVDALGAVVVDARGVVVVEALGAVVVGAGGPSVVLVGAGGPSVGLVGAGGPAVVGGLVLPCFFTTNLPKFLS